MIRAKIIEMYYYGNNQQKDIARELKQSRQTVSRIIKRFKSLGSVEDRPRKQGL